MKNCIAFFAILLPLTLWGMNPIRIELWPDGAPNSNGLEDTPTTGRPGWIEGVSKPELYVYPSERPNGTAVIMCPGGGYTGLATNHEGHDMAEWFNRMGITYAVLVYRMPNGHHEVPMTDAEEAIRIMREWADEWDVSSGSIGIMGASAGGHLATTLATHYSSPETRPDFQILFYPVVSMDANITHKGSRDNLLGSEQTEELVRWYSNEEHVTPETPKAFIMLSSDDSGVSPENSMRYFSALVRNGVPVALHSYPSGGHGWGFNDSFLYKPEWTTELESWINNEVIVK